ncbi:MAG TPA: ABC transporter permease [Stellaceae bacterium]|nr:ABC transporter permease [Stellaceae bacterium]
MISFILRRVLGLLPILGVAVVLAFAANEALPGDPVTVMLSEHSGDTEMAARLRAEYGLDQPVWRQFLSYVGNAARGDFGLSFQHVHTPVTEIVGDPLKISPILALAALSLALPLGAFAGVIAAVRRNSWADTVIIMVLVAGLSIPNFAIATFLVYLFSIKLGVLPVAGWGGFEKAVLPVIVLATPSAAYIARLMRTFMLEVLQQDYIRTARAKGLSRRVVVYRHALRNTLVPLLTSAGIIFGGLLSNTFVVETIFNIPGLGRLAIDAIFARDYPVAMAVVILFTAFFAVINLAVDVLYALIDPRIRARVVSA